MMQETISDQSVIEAERFKLRPPRRGDIGLLTLYAGDRRVAEGARSIPHPMPPGAVEGYVARAHAPDRVEDVWVMDGGEKGHEVLGVISLTRMDRGQAQLGYWVAPAFWNTGIASEAVRALVEANPLGNETLFAEVFQDNPASARVLTNAKFDYIGDAEAHSLARGTNVPTWTYLRKMG
ncbi:GNAT family N-acetyltransferase [Maritimibacter sp. HL-12]|uniref:GNAT family N-acetyltransferase n=1 Tax=Maritimibacter sp. HL-12 TaxID=1162418 RepID=UPI000A0EF25D|nr:GNAT family N-acetyltransferase [Maritimibacter sp. HL-12]SMH55558.1 Protein N-acetyltransferase, RimJ/RimL family [Maritimibacter sp. HL-12]